MSNIGDDVCDLETSIVRTLDNITTQIDIICNFTIYSKSGQIENEADVSSAFQHMTEVCRLMNDAQIQINQLAKSTFGNYLDIGKHKTNTNECSTDGVNLFYQTDGTTNGNMNPQKENETIILCGNE